MKKLILLSMLAVFCLMTANAQTDESQKSQIVCDLAEKMPMFPGGTSALIKYLSTNIKYPADAEKKKVEGRVFVTFVVEIDGSISEVQLTKKLFPSLDQEAVRVVKAMPKWIPGEIEGKLVRVRYTLPITFRLNK